MLYLFNGSKIQRDALPCCNSRVGEVYNFLHQKLEMFDNSIKKYGMAMNTEQCVERNFPKNTNNTLKNFKIFVLVVKKFVTLNI